MDVLYSEEFAKQLKKIRDAAQKEKVIKAIEKVMADPSAGKPLRYELAGKRSLRISPFRLIYEYRTELDRLIFHSFEHRKIAYD